MIVFLVLILFTGCSSIPEVSKSIENIATDDAIRVEIDKDAIQKDTDIQVNIGIQNQK